MTTALFETIAQDLAERGWSVQDNFLDTTTIDALRGDLEVLSAQGVMAQAAIGRSGNKAVNTDIRRDYTFWLSGDHPVQAAYLSRMDLLRQVLNRTLFLGLRDYEAHYALYPPGGFYKKHIDSLRGRKNRIVSTVFYLNENWMETDGGALVLYDPADEEKELARLLPESGRLAVFLSEDIPHEVLPSSRARRSIAGWFRCGQ